MALGLGTLIPRRLPRLPHCTFLLLPTLHLSPHSLLHSMSTPHHSHHSPAAHVRFDVVQDESPSSLSIKDKTIESTIQHARERSIPSPHSLHTPASTLVSSDSFSSAGDEDGAPAYPALASLLASDAAFHIEYHVFLSNHLPHALISLWGLGASARRLLAFSAEYSKKLEPARGIEDERRDTQNTDAERYDGSVDGDGASSMNSNEGRARRARMEKVSITKDTWREYIGHKKHYSAYVAFFQQELQRRMGGGSTVSSPSDGRETLSPVQEAAVVRLVREYVPELLPGSSHSALHPLIHTGWGLCAGPASLPTLCEGLAYMCFAYCRMDRGTDGYSNLASLPNANSLTFLEGLKATAEAFEPLQATMNEAVRSIPYCEMNIGGFQRRLLYLAQEQPGLLLQHDAAIRIDLSAGYDPFVSTLFEHLLLLFVASRNDFFVLHGITGSYALSRIVPLLEPDDALRALRYGVKFVLAAWIAQGLPGMADEGLKRALTSGRVEDGAEWAMEQAGRRGVRRWGDVTWNELRAAAVDSDDEHTIKLVWVCRERALRENSSELEKRLCKLVAWKRLTDEDDKLFHR